MLLLDESPDSLQDQDPTVNLCSENKSQDSKSYQWHCALPSPSPSSETPALMPARPSSCPPSQLDTCNPDCNLGLTNKGSSKPAHMRRNIRKLLNVNQLDATTKAAQSEELDRLNRLVKHKDDFNVASEYGYHQTLGNLCESVTQGFKHSAVCVQPNNSSYSHGTEASASLKTDQSSGENTTSHIKLTSKYEESSGSSEGSSTHAKNALSQPNAQEHILINVNHPTDERDIYLSPQLARAVKPHQTGGIRFLYDNLVESLERFKSTSGFGCILAHSMGLGKTLQVISFIDILLRYTGAHTVLIIVPVNTLHNWLAEFNLWVPSPEALPPDTDPGYITPRTFKLYVLNDEHKTTEARAKVVEEWYREGGVLLMGYEMYRILSLKKSFVAGRKKKNMKLHGPGLIDADKEDHQKEPLKGIERALAQPGPDVVVCDEGHRIKNWQASTSRALKGIGTRRRLVLTGYPLQNNLLEYWCMVDFVRPGFLGTRSEFSNMFERPILNGQCVDSTDEDITLMRYRSHVLHSLLEGFVQRCGHDVLCSQLPEKWEHVILVRLSALQRALYTKFMNCFIEAGNTGWLSLNPLRSFCVCCKIWNHPDILYKALQKENMNTEQDLDLDDVTGSNARCSTNQKAKLCESASGEGGLSLSQLQEKANQVMTLEWAKAIMTGYKPGILENSAKMVLLFHIIDESVKKGDKVLVFSQSLSTLSVIEEFLVKRPIPDHKGSGVKQNWVCNVNYYRLDGSTSASERERLINQFNDVTNNSAWLFLLSTRAGCLGVNLIGANRVVVFDASWNPCHDAQAVCRVYRYGQRKPCYIYRLVCDFTLEKKIYDRQISKQGMSERVIDDLNPVLTFTRREVDSLLHFMDEEPDPMDSKQIIHPQEYLESVLREACLRYPQLITKQPFYHESLLMDRQDLRLTNEEKEAAKKSYEDEKKASVPYTRPSYAHYYPASDQSLTNIPAFSQRNRLPPMQPEGKPATNSQLSKANPTSTVHQKESQGSTLFSMMPDCTFPVTFLQKAGVCVQKIVTTTDIVIPGTNNSSKEQAKISAGESIHIIKGVKGTYIRTSDGRIFAIRAVRKEKQSEESKNIKRDMSTSLENVINGNMSHDNVQMFKTPTSITETLSSDGPDILSQLHCCTKAPPSMANAETTSEMGITMSLLQKNIATTGKELPLDLRATKRKSTSPVSNEYLHKQPTIEKRGFGSPSTPNYPFTIYGKNGPFNPTVNPFLLSSFNSLWPSYLQLQVPKAEPHLMFPVSPDAHILEEKTLQSSSPLYSSTTSTTTNVFPSSTLVTASGLIRHEMVPPRFSLQSGQPLGMYTVFPGGMPKPGDAKPTFLPRYSFLDTQSGTHKPCPATDNRATSAEGKDDVTSVMDQ